MRIRTFYIVLFLLFVVLGVYYPSIFAPVNTVDDKLMTEAIINSARFSFKGIFLPGSSGYYYRPLLWLTFIADQHLWGFQPSFMHLENILLHAMNVVLVFFIAQKIVKRYELPDLLLPLSAALLFALHPINTESVNWISGRTDLLAGTFILISIFLLLMALEKNNLILCLTASFSLLLACFAKDTAIFFFPAALLMIWHYDGSREEPLHKSIISSMRRKFSFYSSYFSVVLIYFTIRHFAFYSADTGIAQAAGGIIGREANFLYALKVMVKLLGFYVKKLFLPWPLNFAIINVSDYYIAVGMVIFISSIYLIYRRDLLSDFLLTSICIISPAFLVALSRMAWTPIAERYLYIPSATFSIGVTIVVYCLFKRFEMEKFLPVLAVMLFGTAAYATVGRNILWQDNLTLFQDTVQKSPDFPPAKNELAVALKEHGRNAEGDRMIRENVIGKDAKNREFLDLNRANLMYAKNDLESARHLLLNNLNPSSGVYPKMLLKLINIDENRLRRAEDKRTREDIREEIIGLLAKLQVCTGDPYFLYKLGQQYMFLGNKVEAHNHFIRAFEAAPENTDYKLPAKKLADKLRQ